MHETLSPNILGYIDEQKLVGNSIKVSGWSLINTHDSKNIRVFNSNETLLPNVENRVDVLKHYNVKKFVKCGWSFQLAVTSLPIDLQMEVEPDNWVSVFNFTMESVQNHTINDKVPINQDNNNNYQTATAKLISTSKLPIFSMNEVKIPSYLIVDNFYANPDEVRAYALSQTFVSHESYHKGKSTDDAFRFEGIKERFEQILCKKIINWETHARNGCFQYCIGGDQLVYHVDLQNYAAIIFLTPDAPPQSGTSLLRSRHTKKMKAQTHRDVNVTFAKGNLDSTEFDVVDRIGNVYNRLFLFDAQFIHSASEYFGNSKENGRLFQIFFFDIE